MAACWRGSPRNSDTSLPSSSRSRRTCAPRGGTWHTALAAWAACNLPPTVTQVTSNLIAQGTRVAAVATQASPVRVTIALDSEEPDLHKLLTFACQMAEKVMAEIAEESEPSPAKLEFEAHVGEAHLRAGWSLQPVEAWYKAKFAEYLANSELPLSCRGRGSGRAPRTVLSQREALQAGPLAIPGQMGVLLDPDMPLDAVETN